jgi:hypothetical protein
VDASICRSRVGRSALAIWQARPARSGQYLLAMKG